MIKFRPREFENAVMIPLSPRKETDGDAFSCEVAARSSLTKANAKKTIVILGDWFINENWLLSRQESYHSAAPGDIHYLACPRKTTEQITSLGSVATCLLMLKRYLPPKDCDFLAYGAWNPADNDCLQRILCPEYPGPKLLSPYTLSKFPMGPCAQCNNNPGRCPYSEILINLASKGDEDDRTSVSTNRVIRCYEGHRGGKPHQLSRIDWIMPLKHRPERYQRIRHDLKNRNVIAIFIIDHGAGVVNNTAISQLRKATSKQKDVKWFVRTKLEKPEWLNSLGDSVTLEMFISDFRLAHRRKGTRRWWYGPYLGRAALGLLSEMTGSWYYTHGTYKPGRGVRCRNAVVLMDDHNVFAMAEKDNNHKKCISFNQPPGPRKSVYFERTTVFTASLFAQRMLRILKPDTGISPSRQLGQECYAAIQCVERWTQHISDSWSKGEVLGYEDPTENLTRWLQDTTDHLKKTGASPWTELDYKEEWQHWNDSSKNLGILTLKGAKVLQMWRGEGVLKDYICVGGPKRKDVNDLVSEIAKFHTSKNPAHSLCCLIQSPPGWGKSILARSLASQFDMEFLEFSITQMSNNQDLIDCFASIASIQNMTKKRTLVFIDEINAEIPNLSPIPLLLSPIWEGTFIKDQHLHRLTPGVWVFASTASVDGLPKGPDFLSRLNGPIINFDTPSRGSGSSQIFTAAIKEINDEAQRHGWQIEEIYELDQYRNFVHYNDHPFKTEQVYLMVSLLSSKWGPINGIEKKVLQLFHDLLPLNGYRSLEFFASCFEGIQRGEVHEGNVPKKISPSLCRYVIIPKWWSKPSERRDRDSFLVRIETWIRCESE